MVQSNVKSTFSTFEVSVLTGFTKNMLDYLLRAEIFAPSGRIGRGVRREYTYADVVILRALNTICAGKGQILHLRRSLAALRDEIGPLRPGQRLERLMFVLGDKLCLRTSVDGGRELRSGQMTLGFFVDLAAVCRGVADCVIPVGAGNDFRLTDDVLIAAHAEKVAFWKPVKRARDKLKARAAGAA